MKILSPVDRPEEVQLLAQAGAHELYGGVQPDTWAGRLLSASQRSFASAHFPSEDSLAEAAAEAKSLGIPVHLTLNAPLYDPADYPELLGLAERAAAWGAAGLILGDLGLLLRVRDAALPLEITLSILAGAGNRHSLGFFRRFGISRAVFPRHLTLAEMERVVRDYPDVGFEALALVGMCPNEEAFCTFQHVSPSKRWPCEIDYDLTGEEGGPLAADHPLASWHGSWRSADRRLACGLCAIPELEHMGVRTLKLVGRGGPTAGKVANVRVVADLLDAPRSREATRGAYADRFGRPCHRLTCYFPELHRDEPQKA